MSETIVIFRKDGCGGRVLRSLPRTAQRREAVTTAPRISTSASTAPPTTTVCIAQSDPATPQSTPTCSTSWNVGDTS